VTAARSEISTALVGLPRIGPDRELKFALEAFWRGETQADALEKVAAAVRHDQLAWADDAGIDVLPSNDFSLYDHVLDTAIMVGAIAPRFQRLELAPLERYFAMARGTSEVRPLEMTKWCDTNYHHLVPELGTHTELRADPRKALIEFAHAREAGYQTRPVLLGPVSFLLLCTSPGSALSPLVLLERLLPVYEEVLVALAAAGAVAIQIDEPCLVLDRHEHEIAAVERAWQRLSTAAPAVELTLATYFGGLGRWLDRVLALPAREFHLDAVRAPGQVAAAVRALPRAARLSLGVIDGRNVWATDLEAVLRLVEPVIDELGADRLRLAPSCSLLHVPYAAAREDHLSADVRPWLAFGQEKLCELRTLKEALQATPQRRRELLEGSGSAATSRRARTRVHDALAGERLARLTEADYERRSAHSERARRQAARLQLPQLPTTTIGSLPQTEEIRAARRHFNAGLLSVEEYERFLEHEIRAAIERQEHVGLDVLVHGEPERSDMVQYFAEQLNGYAVSAHGWVQSYGSRCVKPPILFGNVSRRGPMTLRWWRFAQSCTSRPVKAMLTGPVTMLQWSFVRDDQPREQTCRQLALAVRDEARDLERAGAAIIQIDEAALREGLPLRRDQQAGYLRWAIDCFRLVTGALHDETQVHSHMCYSHFDAILADIARMDADVVSIEASRSQMKLLDAFADFDYPSQIGPGVYDIHSSRVPTVDELESLIAEAQRRIPSEQLWVNPDCGLKTRRWEEVLPALTHLVQAAHRRRAAARTQSAAH
jgi:5-methyltetrahydropteroyltriglutamate--homocysteine methyltransferase